MAVQRQLNLLGNERIDTSFLRSLESAVCGDFDTLAGVILSGQKPFITAGFQIVYTGITQANQLQVQVANSSLIHYLATDSGSIFSVPANIANEILTTTNNNVSGGFAPNATNYVGIDLVRSIDDTTSDVAAFIDSTSLVENYQDVPLARTLKYRIIISTVDFNSSPSVCPIAKVSTGPTNNILLLEDARSMFWRLGSGGTVPNAKNFYGWPSGRNEATSTSVFTGGDKAINSLKSSLDALMTRVWELGGGSEYWYSPTTDKNLKMVTSGSPFSGGEYFEYISSNIHWKGLVILFDNSTGYQNVIADQTSNQGGVTDIADGECIYVDLDRTQNRTGMTSLQAAKTALTQLGPGAIPGSRYIIAWRFGTQIFTRLTPFPVGALQQPATTTSNGVVSVSATPNSSIQPFAVLYDTSAKVALAGGLTRGDASTSGFIGGLGDIVIGGGTNDQNIIVQLPPSSNFNFTILGQQPAGKSATTTIINSNTIANSVENLGLKVVGNQASVNTTVFQVEGNGALGFSLSPTLVAPPAPSGGDGIAIKLYAKTNGLGTGLTRNQLVVIDTDGSESVIWEGVAY